jgi:hypothetical protein
VPLRSVLCKNEECGKVVVAIEEHTKDTAIHTV